MSADLGFTVNDLLMLAIQEVKKGNGGKHILISDDDEGNGYHTLFYGFTPSNESFLELEHDRTHTVDNCIILG